MADHDAHRLLAVVAGVVAAAGPRRTRPLAGVLYGLFLSRAHGAALAAVAHGALAAARRGGAAHQEHRVRLDDLEALATDLLSGVDWQTSGMRERVNRKPHAQRIEQRYRERERNRAER